MGAGEANKGKQAGGDERQAPAPVVHVRRSVRMSMQTLVGTPFGVMTMQESLQVDWDRFSS